MKTNHPSHCRFIFGLLMILAISSSASAQVDENTMYLIGRIKESVFKNDLPKAWVWTIGADGERVDSLPLGYVMIMHLGGDNSQFTLKTNRQDSLYVFEAGCEGYIPQTFTYRVEDAKKEWKLEMPTIYLERAPHKLNELTVTTSKVKFYHRGDTLVYNADAFQLAEGSMLDGLIKQLPGAELSSDGRITVNGEFVETLLLDGKPFFDGNNNLMLKNLGAYMVKNVEVYRGQTAMEKFINNPDAPKHLTMNVKLKKDYNIGWIANVQAGYGTDHRYLGRLFAAWFNPRARVGLVANFNNLNDTRTPGENDNWTPDQMPSGTQRNQMAGLTYNLGDADNKNTLSGNVTYERSTLDLRTSTDRTNFFNTGNTYDYIYGSGTNKDLNISTSHRYNLQFTKVGISGDLKGGYRKQDSRNASASASFNKEQADITMQNIEAIYSTGNAESFQSLINRAITLSDGTNKKGNFDFSANTLYKIPRSSNLLRFEAGVKYETRKESLWDDYDIAYGYNQSYGAMLDSEHRRNFTDNSPNYNLNLNGKLAYMTNIGKVRVTVGYIYMFNRNVRDSYMYTLDKLADMGIYGTLPAGYVSTFDPGNSFVSTQWDNRHSAMLKFAYNLFKNGNNLYISGGLDIGWQHSHLNYFSDDRSYPVKYNSMVATVGQLQTSIIYMPKATPKKIKNRFRYDYTLDTDIPDLLHFVDVVNTSDPLNINLGNPNLKNSYRNHHRFSWQMNNNGWRNDLLLNATHTANALLRGYVYDMETGVRYNRTYNVKGNYALDASDTYSLQFGRRKQFTLSSTTSAGLIHSVEMIGEITGGEVIDPAPSKVNNRNLSENLKLSWQIGRQTISAIGKVSDTRTTRQRYADINATHWNYGLQGQFALPAGFGVSTDFTCYTRRGYGVKELDTTDAVWNARITYTPRGGHWVIAIDGFDLLHQLSNVNYAVTATGRTVTVTNTLPRYILASVQYRFNITPKRR